jgi:aerobic carbon-monoxide dehydrogenase medium subunit
MYPAQFEYFRPTTLDEAVKLLAQHGDDAKLLAGGHSLIPAMKLRLAQPRAVVDLGRIANLSYIREADGRLAIGAMTTHADIQASNVLRARCPLLPETASHIGDMQVRNKGTIGGSLAHADPAADWPAAILALEAELEILGPRGTRTVQANRFFVDLLQTAIGQGEILTEIRVPSTPRSVAYVKTEQKASGFALTGVAAVIDRNAVRIGVTGVAAKPYRATAVEQELADGSLTPERIARAATHAADGVDALDDIHASSEFRAHLAQVNTARALTRALERR